MVDDSNWLVLIYKMPLAPTRIRAAVWRRLRSLGAVYLQDGIAALPFSVSGDRSLRALQSEIKRFGGVGYLMGCNAIAGRTQIIAAYNSARDGEYRDITRLCRVYQSVVESEVAAKQFTYAELERNEEELSKLRTQLAKIEPRDVFHAPEGEITLKAVIQCEKALEAFAQRVYGAEDSSSPP